MCMCMCWCIAYIGLTSYSRPSSLDPLPGNLSPVQTLQLQPNSILILRPLNHLAIYTQNDLEMHGMALVRINPTVGTIRPSACFLMIGQY
jgi:hypothetical protein